jgi:hypothetical protein
LKHNALKDCPKSVLQSLQAKNAAVIYELQKQVGHLRDKANFHSREGNKAESHKTHREADRIQRALMKADFVQRAVKLEYKGTVRRDRAEARLVKLGKPKGYGYNLTSFELEALASMLEGQARKAERKQSRLPKAA